MKSLAAVAPRAARYATIVDGVTGATGQGYGSQVFVAPAPGVAALAALAGLAGLPRGRRRH
jgi:MYXO-CTERM domain-containing protein